MLTRRLERLEILQMAESRPETRIQLVWVGTDGTRVNGPLLIAPLRTGQAGIDIAKSHSIPEVPDLAGSL